MPRWPRTYITMVVGPQVRIGNTRYSSKSLHTFATPSPREARNFVRYGILFSSRPRGRSPCPLLCKPDGCQTTLPATHPSTRCRQCHCYSRDDSSSIIIISSVDISLRRSISGCDRHGDNCDSVWDSEGLQCGFSHRVHEHQFHDSAVHNQRTLHSGARPNNRLHLQ